MSELLIAAFSGVAGGYLNHISVSLSEDAALLSGYIEDVEECSNAVERYWLLKPGDANEEIACAALVRARFAALAVFYGEATNRLSSERLKQYQVLQVRFFKEGTGGQFEGNNRQIDAERAIEAHRISREIVQVLRLARREQLAPLHRLMKLCKKGWALITTQN